MGHGIVTIIRTTTMTPIIAAQASWLDGLFHSTVGIMQLFTIGWNLVEFFYCVLVYARGYRVSKICANSSAIELALVG